MKEYLIIYKTIIYPNKNTIERIRLESKNVKSLIDEVQYIIDINDILSITEISNIPTIKEVIKG